MKLDWDWFDKTKADIDGVDFTKVEARRAFSDALRRNYTARELFVFKDRVESTPCGWNWGIFKRTGSDPKACRLIWDGALDEARSLIVQVRTNGGGAITHPVVEMEKTGEKIPNPEMLFDLPDGLWDLPIATLRANAVRAYERNAPKKKRADAGEKHRKHKKIKGAWRSAADVAEDFNKSAFIPKGGKRKLGTCDEKKINRWDHDYPDRAHCNKFGYYAQLRIDPNLKGEYYEVLQTWVQHWREYKQWDWRHPGERFRPKKITAIDTARLGVDKYGDLWIEPRDNPRRT